MSIFLPPLENFPVLLRSRRIRSVYDPVLICAIAGALHVGTASLCASGTFPWQLDAWHRSADLLVDDALGHLPAARAIRDPAELRQFDYTRAVLLLNSQPKLQRNIGEARSLLKSVRQTRADDELGLSALYYLARIAEFHTEPPDPAGAAGLYAELIARSPAHPFAQAAVSRLAILQLYGEISASDRQAKLDKFAATADRLTLPSARRDLHFVLADVLLNFTNDQEAALRHLLAAEEAGIVRPQLQGDTLVRIALIARQLGHREIAIAHYKKFLSSFQRDARAFWLAVQLTELEPGTAPVSSRTPEVDSRPAPLSSPPLPTVPAAIAATSP